MGKSLWAERVRRLVSKELNTKGYTFYNEVFNHTHLIPTHGIPTIGYYEYDLTIYLNPYFTSKLTISQIASVILHELNHVIMGRPYTYREQGT
jgi:predicted metal-dependent peptidase